MSLWDLLVSNSRTILMGLYNGVKTMLGGRRRVSVNSACNFGCGGGNEEEHEVTIQLNNKQSPRGLKRSLVEGNEEEGEQKRKPLSRLDMKRVEMVRGNFRV